LSFIATLILVSAVLVSPTRAEDQMATGRVFHDKNENRQYDDGEPLLKDIKVSNGQQITKTDANGRYQLPVDDDTILFVIKPRGWRTPLSKDKLPRFYYIHKPDGSPKQRFPGVAPTGPLPESVDFPLYSQEEPDRFQAILFGDPQPRDQKEVDYIAHDVVEELIGTEARFGVTLGDIVFDNLNLFEQLNGTIALIGVPWYNVIGNHDINSDAKDDEHSDETFESVYGPAYYSFDYGPVHFIVLDDIQWVVEGDKRHYEGGLGPKQMEFIKNDLSDVPDDQLVVLLMHIPLVDVNDRHELYRLIEKRSFCMSISGHTHYHEHRIITKEDGWKGAEPHHHVINVTVCGSWWSGKPDERGIPHTMMRDGAPNGYSIITFDGNDYRLRFKAAGKAADYQIRIMAPEAITTEASEDVFIYANVFNGSPKSKVQLRVSEKSPWLDMERHVAADPGYAAMLEEEKRTNPGDWRALPGPENSSHLWRVKLPADLAEGIHLIEVQADEPKGSVYHGRRVLRVHAAKKTP
jgi:hypothetical protein